jgi:tetratricopeptide (TPR) repeat protein
VATHSNAPSLAVIALFQTALQAHQTGRLAEADQGYRQVLAIDPRHADALRLLGLVACQLRGNLNEGLAHISRALAIREDPLFLVDIGNIFLQAGEFLKAEAPYLRAVELNPGYAVAHYNLGVLYRNMARLEDAEKAFRTVLKLRPQDFEAHANLGNTLRDVGRLDEALDCYRAALEISPQDAQLHSNIGTVQQASGKLAEAAQSYRTALKLRS